MPLNPPTVEPLFQYSTDVSMVDQLLAGDQGEKGSQAEVCSLGLAPRPFLFVCTLYWSEAPFKQGTSYSSSLRLAGMEYSVHLLPHHRTRRQGAAVGVPDSHSHCCYGLCTSYVIWVDRHQS